MPQGQVNAEHNSERFGVSFHRLIAIAHAEVRERDFFIDNLLVRIHYIIVMMK